MWWVTDEQSAEASTGGGCWIAPARTILGHRDLSWSVPDYRMLLQPLGQWCWHRWQETPPKLVILDATTAPLRGITVLGYAAAALDRWAAAARY